MFRRIAGLLGLCLTAAIYLYQLDRVPPYLGLDEAHFGVHAHAIATTGRDLNGNQAPLFINLADPKGDQPVLPWGNTWYQPVLFYLVAIVLKFAPLSEFTVRLPTALLGGVINIALLYAVAWRLMRHRGYAAIAAALLAASPAHVLLCRQAADYVCPLPFVLAWFWCLLIYVETGATWAGISAGLALGVGCYTYITSWMLMPFYLALSWFVIARSGAGRVRQAAILSAGFLLPLLLLVPWLWAHPEMLANLSALYRRSDPGDVSVAQAVAQDITAGGLARMLLTNYWDYFNPSFLFVTGSSSRLVSTGLAGVFLWPIAVFLPVGIVALLRQQQLGWPRVIVLVGLFMAPVAAAMKGSPFAIQRATTMLPFVILASGFGVAALWESRHRLARASVVLLLAAGAFQFAGFYRDYLTEYPVRSPGALDPTGFRSSADYLLAADNAGGVPAIFLTAPLYDVSAKWRFYTTMHSRVDLLDRTRYFDGNLANLAAAQPGSLAVVPVDERSIELARQGGAWSIEREMSDISGRPTLTILRKTN